MRGSDFLQTLPEGPGWRRDEKILEAIRAGHGVFEWVPVLSRANGHEATLYVTRDVMRVGDANDSIRMSVMAKTAQWITDVIGAHLQTTKICDLVWEQSMKLPPCIQTPDAAMANTSRMLAHHQCVEKHMKATKPFGLVENAGKHWVISNKLLTAPAGRAANYGWYANGAPYVSASGMRMWQTLGLKHNVDHVDYSQVVRCVSPEVLVDGKKMQLFEVAADPDLCALVSNEGPVKLWRIPSVGRRDYYPNGGPFKGSMTWPPMEEPPAKGKRLTYVRDLKRGDVSAEVESWQKFLGIAADRRFGPITEGATRQFQRNQRLPETGIVDVRTIAQANKVLDERDLRRETDPLVDGFVQARNYTPAARTDIKWIVIHTMESPEKPTMAEAVASWFASANAPNASAHFNVDNDSIVQSVKETDVAWHAKQGNRFGIGIEHAGRAKQSPSDWYDDFSQDMLRQSARLTAALCERWAIPVRRIGPAEILKGEKGICGHLDFTKAFHVQGGHTDPGVAFPYAKYLALVQEFMNDGRQ